MRRQPKGDCLAWMSSILGALHDTRHLRILELLMQQELCVSQLGEALLLHEYEASRILGLLRHAGLLDDRREGRWIYYSISKSVSEDPFGQHLLKAFNKRVIDSGEMAEDFARLGKRLAVQAAKAGTGPLAA
jgi:ArsR family transcriptional regulator